MRWLNRLAACLTGAFTAMSLFLILVLAGSASLGWSDGVHGAFSAPMLLGVHGAALAWPLFALTAGAAVVLLVLAGARAGLRTRRRGAALLLGVIALLAAWQLGIRPPASRSGVFEGQFVYGHQGIRPDLFIPCQDPSRPLPRGADLTRALDGGDDDIPTMAAVGVPDAGWAGSHPGKWPSTYSDFHGVRYWQVRVRGRLIGPGHYGSPPVLHYRLKVDRVLSVAPSRMFQDECGVYHPPAGWPRE